jgi:hypothetical protein
MIEYKPFNAKTSLFLTDYLYCENGDQQNLKSLWRSRGAILQGSACPFILKRELLTLEMVSEFELLVLANQNTLGDKHLTVGSVI